jgi:peptidoglycan/xylan/chitin deacetylase (PgdA/CDA1 family)
VSGIKDNLAELLDRTRLGRLLTSVFHAAVGPHVRAVNYHDVPPSQADAFEEQLRFYAEYYRPVGRDDFERFLAGQDIGLTSKQPGLLITFDDGLRSHAEVAAPLLESFGFEGWFMVPSGFVDTPVEAQADFATRQQISYAPEYADARVAMTWDQLRELDAKHVIGCHSESHRRLEANLSAQERAREIEASKSRFEAELGHAMDVFCWVGGEEWSYSAECAAGIREAGYTLSFMTNNAPILPSTNPLQLQRSNIETCMPKAVVRFNLSGLMDVLYRGKRNRVNQLTSRRPQPIDAEANP